MTRESVDHVVPTTKTGTQTLKRSVFTKPIRKRLDSLPLAP